MEGHTHQYLHQILDLPLYPYKYSTIGMQELGPTRLAYEQTVSFPTLGHHEYPWRRNYTSEIRDNQKLDDSSKIF